ncbi:16978_t:CDS:1, partial [Racocetra fulgida]
FFAAAAPGGSAAAPGGLLAISPGGLSVISSGVYRRFLLVIHQHQPSIIIQDHRYHLQVHLRVKSLNLPV